MLRTLGDEGYTIEWRVVNSAEYGFPQRRIRVFIVARRLKMTADPEAYILRSGILARALPVSKGGELISVEIGKDAADVSESFNRGGKSSPFLSSGVYAGGIAYTMKTDAAWRGKKKVLGDVLVPDDLVPADFWINKERLAEWKYLKGAKQIKRVHAASGTEYNYSEGKMSFPDSVEKPARTILTGEGGSTPSRFKHIIERPRGFRRLLPVELERLNGFKDDWTATGTQQRPVSDTRRAFFMGNALVVGLIERVGIVLAEEFRS